MSVREVIDPEMSIGLNWHVRSVGDARIVWHSGGTGGFRTFVGFDPATGVGAVVLTNSEHGADDIGFHLINSELPLTSAPAPREARVEIEVDSEILATYAREYEVAPSSSLP
jgi:D-alanyl-D-alanine-carboxypeptidase/D-alanyl-D-alanine-endopeptidase